MKCGAVEDKSTTRILKCVYRGDNERMTQLPRIDMLPRSISDTPETAALPVVEVLGKLDRALAGQKRAVLQAPPGAGKTTLVPLALKDRPWLKNKTIIMLEPRRLAARTCAAHMANLLGEKPGHTVGYQVRMDRCIGPATRIEINTEGILTRRIQSDPGLDGVGLLIFDEFHERHIHSDLGLAFALEAAEVFNPELRILVMSATMDTSALSKMLDDAPVIYSQGRTWPVTTHYLDTAIAGGNLDSRFQHRPGDKATEILGPCFRAIVNAVTDQAGDVLVFLPGVAQIRAMANALEDQYKDNDTIRIHPLYGNLDPGSQAAAIAPAPKGNRKIVLATPIAETSLTIQGVKIVVDSGLTNAPRFSPGRGMTQLETLAVSRASADQRRGRAGRTGPGVCYRLWPKHVHQGLIPFNRPEILSADLTPLALELARWGVADPCELKWLDLPPKNMFDAAVDLLQHLGALDKNGRITPHGKALTNAGTHPRLAHMIIRAQSMGQGFTACCLTALAEARDFVSSSTAAADPDVGLRLEILANLQRGRRPSNGAFYPNRAKAILYRARQLASQFRIKDRVLNIQGAGRLLAFAWPGRVAKKRSPGSLSYLASSGSGLFFRSDNAVSAKEYMVAVHVDGNPKNAAVFLAAPYDEQNLKRDFPAAVETRRKISWDREKGAVSAKSLTMYGKLVLKESPLSKPDPEEVKRVLIAGIIQTGLDCLAWSKTTQSFRHRVTFLRHLDDATFNKLTDLSDTALSGTLETWLGPFLQGVTSLSGVMPSDLDGAIRGLFSWEQLQLVDAQAPTYIRVPSGSRIPIRYSEENGESISPVLAVRIQEMFGLTTHPAIARGQVPLTLHLLSPASRPVQITRDLTNFWDNTYKEVKKDLMGRYPKHYWPDDPKKAVPMARAKSSKNDRR